MQQASSDMNNQTENAGKAAALVVKIRVRAEAGDFSAWHARMAMAPAGASGFISSEVNAPAARDSAEWTVVQNFRSVDQMNAWRTSKKHGRLLEEARLLVDRDDAQALREEPMIDRAADSVVTEVITTHVKPGKDSEYRNWAEKVQRAESEFPGYRGVFLQPPVSGQQHYWTTLVRFATPEQLDAWLLSPVRENLLREHKELVESWEHHRLPTAFAGWFPTDTATGESPATWKQSMLVLLLPYPIVMLERRFLYPLTSGLNTAHATFIGNVISVFLIAWVFMPISVAAMKWWLLPRKDTVRWLVPAGAAIVIALYAVELAALSFLM